MTVALPRYALGLDHRDRTNTIADLMTGAAASHLRGPSHLTWTNQTKRGYTNALTPRVRRYSEDHHGPDTPPSTAEGARSRAKGISHLAVVDNPAVRGKQALMTPCPRQTV